MYYIRLILSATKDCLICYYLFVAKDINKSINNIDIKC